MAYNVSRLMGGFPPADMATYRAAAWVTRRDVTRVSSWRIWESAAYPAFMGLGSDVRSTIGSLCDWKPRRAT